MKTINALIILFFATTAFVQGQSKDPEFAKLIDENFHLAQNQYHHMMQLTPKNQLPQSYDEKKDQFIARNIDWWCSGFYPGSLWLIYEQTGDEGIKAEAERTLELIKPNQDNEGTHDLGFMMYCSFGNGYRLTGNEDYKKVIFKSAESLSTRYQPSIKSIQSWNTNKYFVTPVIIDNMMNLELLNWVTEQGGDKKYEDISVNHSNTTIKNHYRNDFSSFHVVDYNLETGKVRRKATWQGAADCSSWSRGQAWGLYGFTMMYRFTRDKKYLKQAVGIANFMLNHPNLPEDKVPFWDFDAPLIPYAVKDASAAAITASALLELGQYTKGQEKEKFVADAKKMLLSLSSDQYRAKQGENGGFLLKHSTGAYSLNSEIDVPLVYADYYFLEALKRYKDWYL